MQLLVRRSDGKLMTHGVQDVRAFIRERDNYYITGHINPDGDSIGACLGLGLALKKMGKKVSVLIEPYHSKYNVIPGQELIYQLFGGVDFLLSPNRPPGITLIYVDCADLSRLTDDVRILADTFPETLCIDHHFSNTNFAKYNYVDSTCSSTCEMIYRLLDDFIGLDVDIASAIYAGIFSDTGGFRHAATSQETLQVSAKLIELGIPFTEISTELMHLRTYTETKLLARILDACKRSEDARIVHVCVPLTMMIGLEDAPDAYPQDMDGVVEYLLNIRRARVSILVYELGYGKVKISLRSRAINVGIIAQHFGGGGHQLAAGATIDGDIFEIRDRILTMVEQALQK